MDEFVGAQGDEENLRYVTNLIHQHLVQADRTERSLDHIGDRNSSTNIRRSYILRRRRVAGAAKELYD
jgi:hypothetical protein